MDRWFCVDWIKLLPKKNNADVFQWQGHQQWKDRPQRHQKVHQSDTLWPLLRRNSLLLGKCADSLYWKNNILFFLLCQYCTKSSTWGLKAGSNSSLLLLQALLSRRGGFPKCSLPNVIAAAALVRVHTGLFFSPMCLNILSGKLFCCHLSDTTLSTTLIQFLGLPPSHGGGVCVSQWC